MVTWHDGIKDTGLWNKEGGSRRNQKDYPGMVTRSKS